jgi:hypothetical protein
VPDVNRFKIMKAIASEQDLPVDDFYIRVVPEHGRVDVVHRSTGDTHWS